MPEPVSFDEASAHLRLAGDTSEQALVESYITAARGWVENYTGRILMQREVTEEHPGFGRFFDLRWRPFDVDSVTIGYTDSDGEAGEVTETIVSGQRVYPAYASWWPSTRFNTGVTLTYTAGYEAADVPQELKQAILLLVGHWFANRETVNVGNIVTEVPFAVESLCDQYRSPGL